MVSELLGYDRWVAERNFMDFLAETMQEPLSEGIQVYYCFRELAEWEWDHGKWGKHD